MNGLRPFPRPLARMLFPCDVVVVAPSCYATLGLLHHVTSSRSHRACQAFVNPVTKLYMAYVALAR